MAKVETAWIFLRVVDGVELVMNIKDGERLVPAIATTLERRDSILARLRRDPPPYAVRMIQLVGVLDCGTVSSPGSDLPYRPS